jgi:hypothetical protein
MPQPPQLVGQNLAPAKNGQPLVPPDEKFWKRYSPHHEFSLSSMTSVALHVFVIAVLVVAGVLAARWGFDSDKPLPLETFPGGGGGNPDGEANGIPKQPPRHGAETADQVKPDENPNPETVAKNDTLKKPTATEPELPTIQAPDNARAISNAVGAMAHASKLSKDVQDELFRNLAGPPKGKGGTGSGGGSGTGTGPGEGAGAGPGSGQLSQRQMRKLRWELRFQVNEFNRGEDHLRQFAALGAILAVPLQRGSFLVYRDLSRRPRQGRIEDISHINRIWFESDDPQTVVPVAQVLGIQPPPALIAFFPQALEQQMTRMEEEYRGRKEADIGVQEKIRFDVVPAGSGRYRVEVSPDQRFR